MDLPFKSKWLIRRMDKTALAAHRFELASLFGATQSHRPADSCENRHKNTIEWFSEFSFLFFFQFGSVIAHDAISFIQKSRCSLISFTSNARCVFFFSLSHYDLHQRQRILYTVAMNKSRCRRDNRCRRAKWSPTSYFSFIFHIFCVHKTFERRKKKSLAKVISHWTIRLICSIAHTLCTL